MNQVIIKKAIISVLAGVGCILAFGLFPAAVFADIVGDTQNFTIDKTYDSKGRTKTASRLAVSTDKLYFYVDDLWWSALSEKDRGNYNKAFEDLGVEFSDNIYPKLTDIYGSDLNSNINKDGKITILVHPMIKEAGGYFSAADGYSKLEVPTSNEREMVYLNARRMLSVNTKIYLAHEFTHLIDFNQKDIIRSVSEDDWLNEARADFSSTLLGYDDSYHGSNLEERVKVFLADPQDSVTEWLNEEPDYASASLFVHYLVEQYGVNIISETMSSNETGIASINSFLKRNGQSEDFDQIFSNWLMAVSINDCSYGPEFCYKNENLKKLKVPPKINYLPTSGEATLSVLYNSTYYAGNWQKVVGGKGNLKLDVSGGKNGQFSIRYFLCDSRGTCSIKTIPLNSQNKGSISLANFDTNYSSLTLVQFVKGKISGFDEIQPVISYSFTISLTQDKKEELGPPSSDAEIANLLARIDSLKKEIARIQTILATENQTVEATCSSLTADLSLGASGPEVKCLQEFLKAQGPSIYPEAIVSGNFLSLTQSAVIRFQEKYASEILAPLGLKGGTGYVGAATRKVINRLMVG
ncbi:MAG: peptidoglycan-binding domain-containing protein [Candidatus Nealsonbacteria bacterium]|nr:peptidoglycan-binding domain-containing protein [Candidatus Nealsonbacteria bacterium]